jgi:hypothetical protein
MVSARQDSGHAIFCASNRPLGVYADNQTLDHPISYANPFVILVVHHLIFVTFSPVL